MSLTDNAAQPMMPRAKRTAERRLWGGGRRVRCSGRYTACGWDPLWPL